MKENRQFKQDFYWWNNTCINTDFVNLHDNFGTNSDTCFYIFLKYIYKIFVFFISVVSKQITNILWAIKKINTILVIVKIAFDWNMCHV